jgi:hypothetical protein
MKVQLAYNGPRRLDSRVLRVLQYNDQVLGESLDHNALEARLGNLDAPPDHDENDLFGR